MLLSSIKNIINFSRRFLQTRSVFSSLLLGLVVAGLFSATLYVFALPYAPGETTNPSCSPGDADCTVDASATAALSNLASVAINTSLVSDTDNTDALGSSSIGWSDLFLGSGAVINFNNGDVTLTHASNKITVAGGDLEVPDEVYGVGWDASTEVPTKNALYDKIEASLAGANTALSNLASVAINTSLVSDTDNTDALGSATIGWSDLFLGSGAVINFNNGDVTVTHASNKLTIAGGVVDFGSTPTVNGDEIAYLNGIVEGRLTLTTAVPITTSDVTAAGTIYFTPYRGNRIALYNGTNWKTYTFTEKSLALTLTSGKNYDVYIYDNSGTLTLELSAAWTNDTTRADALALQDGVYVKSGATTRRYLGTIRASGTDTTEDSNAKRFVWNNYNRVLRTLEVKETTDNWTYDSATWRQANNSTANQVEIVVGLRENSIEVQVSMPLIGNAGLVGIGVNSVTAGSAAAYYSGGAGNYGEGNAIHTEIPRLGYSYYAWLERSASGTVTFIGDSADSDANGNSKIIAQVMH